ncbi:cytochrome P450 [Mycena vulgaris]|nr:cytochrome P450 [Mycena vulgaris]
MDHSLTIPAILLGGVAVVYFLYLRRQRQLPLPPGPPKLPLIGNLLAMPSSCQWEVYAQWSKQFNSDIIHLNLAGTSMVVLSSLEAAEDLLDRRSAIYSDSTFRPVCGLPRVVSANMISVAYGLDVMAANDPYMKASDAGLDVINAAVMPGRFLVDSIPILKYVPAWVPGAGFKRQAAEWKKIIHEMVDLPFEAAKRALNDGTAHPSFLMDNLQSLDEYADKKMQEDAIKGVAGTMYGGGIDTSRLALRVFVRGILENPEAQKKAQQEIDSVVRSDEVDLPYVSACVKETLRWWPITPLGLPRLLHVKDTYRGYHIPTGSFIMANAWAMLHDEAIYPNPHAFNPDRFLIDGKLNPAIRDPDAVFGFGRRVCAGKDMAWNTLWIMVASMLATFDITKAVGENGEVLEPPPGHTSELVDSPLPFKCSIKPRSKEVEDIIRSTANSA